MAQGTQGHEDTALSRQGASDGPRADDSQPVENQTERRGGSWTGVLKRTFTGYRSKNLSDWAAALTYYGILAMFPAIIALLAIVGLIGPSATQPLIDNLGKLAPGAGREIFTNAVQGLAKDRGAAGALFVIGIVGALWSASSYIGAFMRASNAIYEIEEGRPIWTTIPVRVGLTLVLMVLLAVSSLAVVITGGLARQVGNLVGVGNTAVSIWDIAKWPVLLLVVSIMFSLLYWAAPNVKHPGHRWLSPGGLFAVLIWVIASALFTLYVSNFGSYNKTYGALAGVIIFLVWLWISNVAILLGAELNAEVQRGRAIDAGRAADDEPFVEPREEAK